MVQFCGDTTNGKRQGLSPPAAVDTGMFGYSILRSTLKNAFFSDLFRLLKEFDVPLEGLHTETGPAPMKRQ
jgi:glutamine synthetase